MSSTNLKGVSCLPHMLTVLPCPSNTSVMICSKKTLNSIRDSMHPCLEPLSNRSIVTALVAFLYRLLIEHTMSSLILYFFIVSHNGCMPS